MNKRDLLLYLDIPFCPVHCHHCAKPALLPHGDRRSAYAKALKREVLASAGSLPEYEISAVFIGGGIAGHMMDEELGLLLKELKEHYHLSRDVEITLKVHPGMVSAETIAACRRGGVTRLSLEYVTGSISEHEELGRFLNPQAMDVTAMLLQNNSMERSFDLVVGLPGQTRTSLLGSIQKALGYGASHISLYPFRLQTGTALAEEDWEKRQGNLRKRLPEALEVTNLMQEAKKLLLEHGFSEYLPNRFALSGKECRYFQKEAAGVETLAFGLGAVSCLDGIRSTNTANLGEYLLWSHRPDKIIDKIELI